MKMGDCMSGVSKAKVSKIISCDSDWFVGTFIKIYCTDNKDNIIKDFVKIYNELNDKYMSPLIDTEQFEEYPTHITKKNCSCDVDGVVFDIGAICMEWFGYVDDEYCKEIIKSTPLVRRVDDYDNYEIEPFNYDCIEVTMKKLIKLYGKLEYEGVVAIENGMVRYTSWEGSVKSYIIGNRSDYTYTYNRIKKDALRYLKDCEPCGLMHLKQRDVFRLWDDDESVNIKDDIREAVLGWYSYYKTEKTDEEIMEIILNNSYKSDKYAIMLIGICASVNPRAVKEYLQEHKRKINNLLKADESNRELLISSVSEEIEREKQDIISLFMD